MDREVGLLNEGVRPHPAHEGILLDELTVGLDQDGEDVDGFPGQRYEFPIPKEEVLGAIKAEGTELPLEIAGPNHQAKPQI